jgi:hypothetical protein
MKITINLPTSTCNPPAYVIWAKDSQGATYRHDGRWSDQSRSDETTFYTLQEAIDFALYESEDWEDLVELQIIDLANEE